jgi:hypothetical protein
MRAQRLNEVVHRPNVRKLPLFRTRLDWWASVYDLKSTKIDIIGFKGKAISAMLS